METAAVRRVWRSGNTTAAKALPASWEALLALLPEALRVAVLAHFDGNSTCAVDTDVGTNENAAGNNDSDGAVTR